MLAKTKKTNTPIQPPAVLKPITQIVLQNMVIEIKVLDYMGGEHTIQVSVNNDKPILEGWEQFTIVEDINALICGYLQDHGQRSLLGFKSTLFSQKQDGFIKSIEWEAKRIHA